MFPDIATKRGRCPCCKSSDALLIAPSALQERFEFLTSIYVRDPQGRLLVEWLQTDWALFEHPSMESAHAKELLAEILDDGEVVRQRFAPSERCRSDTLDRWQKFRSELMYENRFFPALDIDLTRLEQLLTHLLLTKELPRTWYRARIQEDAPLSPSEMGAPPKKKASFGRANPAGIPYLYLASDAKTAISEIRPHAGESASVARFSIPDGLKVVDLGNPRRTVSPFLLQDETEVALLRGDISFLEHLGRELTQPVLPQAAAIAYTPTQYLCEFIKRSGFDGVMYRSSVGDGTNVALFDPRQATVHEVLSYCVSKVSVQIDGVHSTPGAAD